MTELEPMLREHFSAEADDVSVDANLLDGVDRLRRGRRHRRLVGGGSALAVAVIAAAVAVPLAVVGHHDGTTGVTVGANRSTVPPKAPPGYRAVTWAGIQFYVPATWLKPIVSTGPCDIYGYPGGLVSYPSSVPTIAIGCLPRHPVLEVFELGTAGGLEGSALSEVRESPAPEPTSSAGTLAGLPAEYVRVMVRGQLVTSVGIPSLGTVFTLTTNTRSRAAAILGSAHSVSADENGCPVDEPANLEKVAGGGAGGPQVRGTPVTGVVCSYDSRRLATGATLTTQHLVAIVRDLNRLPARYTPAELAAQQSPYAFNRGGLASIMLTDADGRTQQITVRGSLPGVRPGVAGATQTTVTQALTADLSDALPSGFGPNAYKTGPEAELPPG